MTNRGSSACTVCSLLCSTQFALGSRTTGRCSLRAEFFNVPRGATAGHQTPWETVAAGISEMLCGAQRPLIWLDGADVQSTRAAVKLADAVGAPITVTQTIGQRTVQRVMASDGWLGSTLAEMAEHSQLIIALGDGWLTKTPLLLDRFIATPPPGLSRHWWHITQNDLQEIELPLQPTRRMVWPRAAWYEKVCQLAYFLRDPSCEFSGSPSDYELATSIAESSNTTILLELSDIDSELDEMVIQQWLTLSRWQSRRSRCSLLAIDADVGQATAQAALLWLTGCATTACPSQRGWISPEHLQSYTLQDWQREFDGILMVRTTPSVNRLPALSSQMTLCENPGSVIKDMHHGFHLVAAAGIEANAFLHRGDHAVVGFAPKVDTFSRTCAGRLPSAADLLAAAAQLALANNEALANKEVRG